MTQKLFSRKKSKSNIKKEIINPDSDAELRHKERDGNSASSTIRSWDSKPSSKEEEFVNSMSESVRERCIELIDAVNVKGMMTDLEITRALVQLLTNLVNEFEDVSLMRKLQNECQFNYSSDLEKIKLFFTAKERPYCNPLLQGDQEMHFKSEYRRPEMIEMVRNQIKEYLDDEQSLPYTALLQTAFAGKSRMVHELSTTVPTIYINLGEEDRFPFKTEDSARFFEALRNHDTLRRDEDLKRCLLQAIQELSNFIESLNSQTLDAESLEQVWQAQVSGKTSFLNQDMLKSDSQAGKEAWSKFHNALSKKSYNDKLKVLLVIDEARVLRRDQSQDGDLFRHLRRALHGLSNNGMFTLFVDTTSQITDFVGPEEQDSSFIKGPLKDMRINPPIYAFDTFDTFLDDQIVSTRKITDKDKLLRMGRPMWYGFQDRDYADVVEMAERKLAISGDHKEGKLASIMCLFAIPHHGTLETASSLLASNMAFPAYIAPSRTLLKVVYRSEPVLVHAAHMVLKDHNFVHLLDLLNSFMMSGDISTGNRGEIMARVLILKKLTDKHSEVDCSSLRGVNLLKVEDFLRSMGFSIDSAIPHGIVHFSHWTKIDCEPSPHVMLMCLLRGTAIACRDNKRVIDMIIPVLIDTEENHKLIESLNLTHSQLTQSERLEDHIEKVIAKCISFVAIQVKCNPRSRDRVRKFFFEHHKNFFKKFSANRGIVIHLQMCGKEKADHVSLLSNNHTYIYRESMEAWHLGRDETERMKNLLNYVIGPRPGIDSKYSLDMIQKYLERMQLFR